MRDRRPLPVIKVVGPSAAGKSTLVAALRAAGYDARPVSQEHAGVPDLWRKFELAHALIFLHVSLEAQQARRPGISRRAQEYAEEMARLAHAREHADLVIDTSTQAPATTAAIALAWLRGRGLGATGAPLPPHKPTGAPR